MPARLKAARVNRGLSLERAAEQIGVSGETLRRAENGQTVPHAATAKQICDFYDFQVTDIWPVPDTENVAAA